MASGIVAVELCRSHDFKPRILGGRTQAEEAQVEPYKDFQPQAEGTERKLGLELEGNP